jgi:hypothetical protein
LAENFSLWCGFVLTLFVSSFGWVRFPTNRDTLVFLWKYSGVALVLGDFDGGVSPTGCIVLLVLNNFFLS